MADGVADQISQHLLQFAFVAHNETRLLADVADQGDAFSLSRGGQAAHGRLNQSGDVNLFDVQVEFAGIG